MASPTSGEIEDQWKKAVDLLQTTETGLAASATKFDTYIDSIESDYAQAQSASATAYRRRASSTVASSRQVTTPILQSYIHHIVGTPSLNINSVLTRLYDYFVDNSKTIKSRGITFGDPSAGGSNVGDGTVLRVTVDASNYNIESVFLEARTITCISDAQSGANKHQEVFEVRGTNPSVDALSVTGSGLVSRNLFARVSTDGVLDNATFSKYSVTTAPTAGSPTTLGSSDTITNWAVTSGAVTSLQLDIDQYARAVVGDSTPTSLRFLGNVVIKQTLSDANVAINSNAPYYLEVWCKREGNATGNVTITCGSQSQVFTIASMTNNEWNRVRLSLDRDLWPERWNTSNAGVSIGVDSLATSTVVFDEVCFAPMYKFDNTYLHVSPASTGTGATPGDDFLTDDVFTFTDALAGSDSKLQYWLFRAYKKYLPHAGSPTIADP